MTRKYPPAVTWFMLTTLGAACLFLVIGSPPHRENDPLFWFIFLNVLGLLLLSIMLHYERSEEDRESFIRVFSLMDWLLAVGMAVYVIWKHVHAGTFWAW